jgi:hypothetical protein
LAQSNVSEKLYASSETHFGNSWFALECD